jgi:MoCo/4Fe-4S cofactor protein with predicted Tat translocation signal
MTGEGERRASIALPVVDATTSSAKASGSSNGGGCGCGSTSTNGHGCNDEVAESPSKVFWRSIDDKNNTAEFERWSNNEFQEGASELNDDDRRTFLKVMGASLALAGAATAGCRRLPEQYLKEYANRPENRIPGTPVKYATSWELDGVGRGLVVTSVDARPIKVDGNAKHSGNLGSSDSITQATILELYDPDRSRTLTQKGTKSSIAKFREWCASLSKDGLAILAQPSMSPSLADMKARLTKKFPGAKWYEWSAVNDDAERQGTEIAFGQPMRPILNLANAKVIVSLDSDFLMTHPNAVRHARDFAASRRIPFGNKDAATQEMSRLYVIESALTVTGMTADERVVARSVDVAAVAATIAAALGVGSAPAKPTLTAHDEKIVAALIADLEANKASGSCVVVAGPGQPAAVHALAALLNDKLNARDKTVSYVQVSEKGRTAVGDLKALVDAINAGQVKTLAILGGNPVYDAPADLGVAAAFGKVGESVHLGYHADETSKACTWHVPQSHYLESWGDTRAFDGTIAPQQPLIAPMLEADQGGLSAIELCAELMNEDPRDGQSVVRRAWMAALKSEGADFAAKWRTALNDGVVPNTAWTPAKPTANEAAVLKELAALPAAGGDAVEVTFAACPKVYDGRFANNAWLQELPDPVSKITWDNAAYMSVAMGERLGLKNGDKVSISASGETLEAAAWLVPGMADRSIRLNLGYGRGELGGAIAKDAGFNAYAIRTSDAMGIARGANVSKLDGTYPFAHTQDHGVAEAAIKAIPEQGIQDRLPSLVRQDTLKSYRAKPDFAKDRAHVASRISLWDESNLDGAKFRWAMAIDLAACTGCGACVTACQAENNIPVVGKAQVMRGREMHWMRIDRYFLGSDTNRPVAVTTQPVSCQHCENAPCEQVCPVAATVHDVNGLNVMVYNRCIGTRYCSNNCPYKVRRFNFFDYHRKVPDRQEQFFVVDKGYYFRDFHEGTGEWKKMQFNPEVTVRSRGVMEKCTFCVQRIQHNKIAYKNAWAKQGGTAGSANWSIPDGAMTTACSDACPTQAITFGDLNDSKSLVAQAHADMRAYGMLEELHTKPRLKYLARVTNPSASEELMHIGHDHGHGHGDDHGHDHDHDHDHGKEGTTHGSAIRNGIARVTEVLS